LSDKPLHVRVAEALGWTPSGSINGVWWGNPHDENAPGHYAIPRYDTDWSATGPLIERYGITLDHQDDDGTLPDYWRAKRPGFTAETGHPLIAVCYLILALHEAGKLP
jgi:hypothetical protein